MKQKLSELIKLDKPLVIFDVETTGLSMTMDKIIEIAYLKVFPDGRLIEGDIFLNPEIRISEESIAIHGITNEQVADKPAFKEVANNLWAIFENSYYSGFNVINFDLPILRREFLRVGYDFNYDHGQIIDSKVIYNYMEPRTLSAAYKLYCEKEHLDAHSALADVRATKEILEAQLEKYAEARDWEFINKLHKSSNERFVDNDRKFYWRDGEAHFSFSKHRDSSLARVAETDPGFLQWILTADFSEETKNIVRKALSGSFPKKAAAEGPESIKA